MRTTAYSRGFIRIRNSDSPLICAMFDGAIRTSGFGFLALSVSNKTQMRAIVFQNLILFNIPY